VGTASAIAAVALLAGAAHSGAVVGGERADRADYPYFATVGGVRAACGGTLVTPDRVLTAAHCRDVVGVGDRVRVGPDEVVRRVELIAAHPLNVRRQAQEMSDAPAPADVMLLKLAESVDGVPTAAIGLPEEGLTAPGTLATTIGVGATRPNGGGGGSFRSGEVRIQADKRCRRELPNRIWRKWSLCTRDPRLPDPDAERPFTSACFGDSGGPLLVNPGDGERVVGVVSFGSFCGRRHDPEVYADAVRARNFILADEPPWAPEADGPAEIVGRPRVGQRVRCEIDWLVPPTTRSTFFWTAGFRALRQEMESIRLDERTRGRMLRCSVIARTRGGTTSVVSPPVRVRG
jgi:hypothetical protein